VKVHKGLKAPGRFTQQWLGAECDFLAGPLSSSTLWRHGCR
jgi:hypothetical protein